MPADHVATVQRIYMQWALGNFSEGFELYDPHVVLVLRPEFPESGAHYGREAIREYMRGDFLQDFEDATISGEEFLASGDSVLVRVEQRASGPRSGAPVSMRYYQAWTFRGDSVIRLESIMERSEALDAVGLSE